MTLRQLEIGPGPSRLAGDWAWETLDHPDNAGRTRPDHVAIWGEEDLPCEANTYDLIYASHVLEHVAWYNTHDALCEVLRILKPGGAFEVWVPDFAYLVQCYISKRCGDNWRKYNPAGDTMLWLAGRVFTYGPEPNWHKALFDVSYLTKCLEAAGFCRISKLDKPRGHDHGPINLGLVGYKP